MRKEDVTEVLQWMHLAMGTDASLVFSEETPVDLNSVLGRLQQLKAESDSNKNEVDRYKKELEDVNSVSKREIDDLKSKYEETVSQLTKELEARNGDTERIKAEWESGLEKFLEPLTVEIKKVSELTKELEASKEEIVRHKEEKETAYGVFNESLRVEKAKVSQLTKELDLCREEIDRFKMERDESTTAFKDVLTLKNSKIRQMEVDLEKVRAESSVYQEKITSMMAAESTNGVVALQIKIQQFKSESDFNKKEIDRYKKELEEMATKSKNDSNELRQSLQTERTKVSQLTRELETSKREIARHKNSLDTNVQIISLKSALQLKMEELKMIMKNSEEKSADLRGLIAFSTGTTIRAKFTAISKLTATSIYSQSTNIAGINWKIQLFKTGDHLSIYLNGQKHNSTQWSCSAFFETQLISQKNEGLVLSKGSGQKSDTFNVSAESWGHKMFISYKDLFDATKGYVNDDSIIVAVVFKAFTSN